MASRSGRLAPSKRGEVVADDTRDDDDDDVDVDPCGGMPKGGTAECAGSRPDPPTLVAAGPVPPATPTVLSAAGAVDATTGGTVEVVFATATAAAAGGGASSTGLGLGFGAMPSRASTEGSALDAPSS